MAQSLKEDLMLKMLKELYLQKKENNPLFSMRAFAKQLEMDQSLLSKVLGGRRPMGPKLYMKLSEKLITSDTERIYLRKINDSNQRKPGFLFHLYLELDQAPNKKEVLLLESLRAYLKRQFGKKLLHLEMDSKKLER